MSLSVWIQQLPNHMTEAFGSARGLVSRHAMRNLGLISALILTMVATALGLTDLIAASEAGEVGPIESVVVGALAGTAILTMWLALEFAIEAQSWGRRVLALLIYVMLVLWSVGFGFGFYWRHLASIGIAQDDTTAMMRRVDESLDTAATNLTTIRMQLRALSEDTQARASQEGRQGDACDGVDTGRGEGDYWNLRTQMSNDVNLLIRGMSIWIGGGVEIREGVKDPLIAQIEALDVQATRDQAEFAAGTRDPALMRRRLANLGDQARSVLGRANAIINGKDAYIASLRALSRRLRAGYLDAAGHRCKDSALADSLDRAAGQLGRLAPISLNEANLDPQLGARATQFAFNRLWKNAFAILPGDQVEQGGGLTDRDLQALVAAIVVDIVIFFLTVFGRRSDPTGSLARLLRGASVDSELLRRLQRQINPQGGALRALFDRSVVRFRDRLYLVTSEDLPARYDPIRHLQTVLLAAGEVAFVPLSGPRGWTPDRAATLAAVQRHLTQAGGGPGGDPELAATAGFAPERVSAVRMRAELVLALQRLFSYRQDEAENDPVTEPAGAGNAGGGGSEASSPRDAGEGQGGPDGSPR